MTDMENVELQSQHQAPDQVPGRPRILYEIAQVYDLLVKTQIEVNKTLNGTKDPYYLKDDECTFVENLQDVIHRSSHLIPDLKAKMHEPLEILCSTQMTLDEACLRNRMSVYESISNAFVHTIQELPPNLRIKLGHIRWMIRRDMPEVMQIENESFEFPWSEENFIRCLRQRNCIGIVAEFADKIYGIMIYELHRNRFHVLNIAASPEGRREGVGTQMVHKLVGKLPSRRRDRIMLEVRETNLVAQQFFRSLGFRAISVLRDFYDNTREDAYLMQYKYDNPDSTQNRAPTRIAG